MSESIFEKSIDDELAEFDQMFESSDDELPTIEEDYMEEVAVPTPRSPTPPPRSPTPPPQRRKGRKPLSDERKAQLRAQLARGRESSLKKRQNNSKLRKLKKAKEIVADEHDIVMSTKSVKELQDEIKLLKKQMNNSNKNVERASMDSLNETQKKVVNDVPAQPTKPAVVENTGPQYSRDFLRKINSKYYY